MMQVQQHSTTWHSIIYTQGKPNLETGFVGPENSIEFEINLDLSNHMSECRLKSRLTTTVDKGGTLGALI